MYRLLSTKNDKEKLNNECRALIEKYDDLFPEGHPGMPPRRNMELKIELKEGAERFRRLCTGCPRLSRMS
jgi:hypothetical protein